jgi:hypothetical protein
MQEVDALAGATMSLSVDVASQLPVTAAYQAKMMGFDKMSGDLDSRFEVRTSAAGVPVVVLKSEKWNAQVAGGAGEAGKGKLMQYPATQRTAEQDVRELMRLSSGPWYAAPASLCACVTRASLPRRRRRPPKDTHDQGIRRPGGRLCRQDRWSVHTGP